MPLRSPGSARGWGGTRATINRTRRRYPHSQHSVDRMAVRLVDEIVRSVEKHRSQAAAATAEYSNLRRQDEHVCRLWYKVYPDVPELTTAVQERIVRRLLRLARFLRQRFWDFQIANRLLPHGADLYTDVALRLLAHACAGNEAELRFCLDRSQPLFPTVAERHEVLFGEIEFAMSTGLPPTPSLSQAEMARALGVSYGTFRGAVRAGHWRPLAGDAIKHKRRRQWRHFVVERHADALQKIRRRLSQRMWSNLPSELRNLVSE